MFSNLFGKKKIQVVMIDADTNVEVDRQEISTDKLPETFTGEGKLEGAGKEWTVLDVSPKHKHEYTKTGIVTMKVREVKYINPKDVLMSLSTISDELPKLGTDPFSKENYINMHEDDWRQVEFISRAQLPLIEKEFESIREIFEKHTVPFEGASFGPFNKLHVRKLIPNPIPENLIDFEELKKFFGIAHGSLTFSTSNMKPYAFVTKGFSFRVQEQTAFYGNVVNGNSVANLGIKGDEDEVKEICEQLKSKYDLLLVDWLRVRYC